MAYMATATVQERREQLESAVKSLASSEGWAEFLKFRSKLHNYSWANTMMIMMQRRDASVVMGYGAKDKSTGWLSVGRQVRKGEKAIKIFAPRLVKDDNDPTGKGKKLIGFLVVNVFDVSQTDGDPIPADNSVALLDGEAPAGFFESLSKIAEDEGLRINYAERSMLGNANGMIERGSKVITLCDDLSDAQRAKTLCHEIAHWFDLGEDGVGYSRGDAECVAESAAYIVSATAGLETDPYSVGYVAGWAKGDLKVLQGVAERTDKAAQTIIKKLAQVKELVPA